MRAGTQDDRPSLLKRAGYGKTFVAIAAKNVRMLWTMLITREEFASAT
ncbi:MAG TPA: hypothetical protein VF450_15110 [Noviherbaspirillum sp.]